MSLLDIFKSAVTPAQPTQNPGQDPNATPNNQATPGNIPASANQQTSTLASTATAPNGSIPATTADIANKSPLDDFSKLWETDPNQKPNDPYFNINMEALNKAAAAQDFTSSITQEHLTAISQGGETAMKAFVSAMQGVARDTYAKNAIATTKIVENALNKAENNFKSSVPGMIKQHALNDGLRTENPAFSHPAAQPIIGALEKQLTQKYPNATANELRSMATQYLSAFATAANPATQTTNSNSKDKTGEMDWSTFLE
jgi:hypothetical protein